MGLQRLEIPILSCVVEIHILHFQAKIGAEALFCILKKIIFIDIPVQELRYERYNSVQARSTFR